MPTLDTVERVGVLVAGVSIQIGVSHTIPRQQQLSHMISKLIRKPSGDWADLLLAGLANGDWHENVHPAGTQHHVLAPELSCGLVQNRPGDLLTP